VHTAFQGISFRLAKVTVVLAFFLGISMTGLQLYMDFLAQSDTLDVLAKRVSKVIEPPATRAVHTLDDDLSLEVVNSLLAYDFVYDVVINDELGNALASGSKPVAKSSTSWLTQIFLNESKTYYTELLTPEYGRGVVGQVVFKVDVNNALADFYARSYVVLLSGVIRNFILSFLLFFAFYKILAKPLIKMNKEVLSINPEHPGDSRLSLPHLKDDNELKELGVSINHLLNVVEDFYTKRVKVENDLRESEGTIRTMINELPAMVVARDADGFILFSNYRFSSFCGKEIDEISGKNIFDLEFLYNGQDQLRDQLKDNTSRLDTEDYYIEGYFGSYSGEKTFLQVRSNLVTIYGKKAYLIVMYDISDLKSVEERMTYMAYHDTLTGLPNRPHLVERLENEIIRARRHKYCGAVLFIDLDHFKTVNDSLGHPVGDELLRQVAQRLNLGVREEDLVSRLSGDEFVVVLTVLGDDFDKACLSASEVAEKLRESISLPYQHGDINLHISCSIGVKIYSDEITTAEEILRFADTAMYQVKNHGRNAIEFFNEEMSNKVNKQLILEGELHKAHKNKEFVLFFQPKYEAKTQEIVGAEALIRWFHPERGMVPPGEFIGHLESIGLMSDVGYWIVEEGCKAIRKIEQAGHWRDGMRLSINISPKQLLDNKFVTGVQEILEKNPIPANSFDFEVTESVAIGSIDNAIDIMNELIKLGISFSLDDFGTGYSSISYLKKLPVENLKVDYSFVRDIVVDFSDRVLVETIITMGQMLGLKVVAEGVETEEQLKILDAFGCDYYQGFYFARPLPMDDFLGLISSNNSEEK
jgi:diguanylate cyclase (GGDEF)-like protein/PAS domain S-box-containing protein